MWPQVKPALLLLLHYILWVSKLRCFQNICLSLFVTGLSKKFTVKRYIEVLSVNSPKSSCLWRIGLIIIYTLKHFFTRVSYLSFVKVHQLNFTEEWVCFFCKTHQLRNLILGVVVTYWILGLYYSHTIKKCQITIISKTQACER